MAMAIPVIMAYGGSMAGTAMLGGTIGGFAAGAVGSMAGYALGSLASGQKISGQGLLLSGIGGGISGGMTTAGTVAGRGPVQQLELQQAVLQQLAFPQLNLRHCPKPRQQVLGLLPEPPRLEILP